MNQRIEELLEKYWDANSSLEEERELKSLLANSEGYEAEKELFSDLEAFAQEEPISVKIPKRKIKKHSPAWLNWAASVAILFGSFWGWRVYEQKQAEEEAYYEVMQAFAIIQGNLAKGQEQMQVMNDLKYLNTTQELFGTNQD